MVSAAPRQELGQRLRHDGGDRAPRHAGMLPDSVREPGRHLDREHHGCLRHRDPPRCHRLIHIPAGLPRRAPEPPSQHPGRLSRRHPRFCQLHRCVDTLSMLAAISAATNNHAINILPDMSLVARDTPGAFQPPVAQRDIKPEVIYCVGGVISPALMNVALHGLEEAAGVRYQSSAMTSRRRFRAPRRWSGTPTTWSPCATRRQQAEQVKARLAAVAGAPGPGLQRGQDADRPPRARASTSWGSTSAATQRQAADQAVQGGGQTDPGTARAPRCAPCAAATPWRSSPGSTRSCGVLRGTPACCMTLPERDVWQGSAARLLGCGARGW